MTRHPPRPPLFPSPPLFRSELPTLRLRPRLLEAHVELLPEPPQRVLDVPPVVRVEAGEVGLPRVRGQLDIGADVGSSDRKSTRLNSSHLVISYAVFCLKKKN